MESSIIRIKHGSLMFVQYIGMSSLSKDIRKELGYPISSEPDQEWWVFQVENKMIGFCSAIVRNNSVHFCHAFVYKEFRGKGIYGKMFNERMDYYKNRNTITAVATKMSLNTFLRNGFTVTNKTKNYTFVKHEKAISNRID